MQTIKFNKELVRIIAFLNKSGNILEFIIKRWER